MLACFTDQRTYSIFSTHNNVFICGHIECVLSEENVMSYVNVVLQ